MGKEGVLEFLTKQLVKIYEEEEKPKNALEYLKNNFVGNDSAVNGLKIENLEKEKENLEKENFQLKETNTRNSMEEYVVPPVSNDVPEKDVEKVIANEDEPMETEKVEDISEKADIVSDENVEGIDSTPSQTEDTSEKAETVSDDVEGIDNTPSQPEDVPEKAETVSEDVEGIDNTPSE